LQLFQKVQAAFYLKSQQRVVVLVLPPESVVGCEQLCDRGQAELDHIRVALSLLEHINEHLDHVMLDNLGDLHIDTSVLDCVRHTPVRLSNCI